MWWGIGIGGFGGVILYLIILWALGLTTLRKGHKWMFWLGIIFPLLWLIGAFMQPTNKAATSQPG